MGALGSLASTRAFEPFGIEVEPAVIVQRRFGAFDPLSLPVYEFNMDEALSPLRGKMLLMDRCRPLLMGIASDPRLVPVPLARSEQHAQVWGEASWNPEEPNVRHAFDAQDLASPLVVSMGVKALDASGERPVLVALGSRAPLENRFIYEAGNRHLVLHAIKWLTGSGDAVGLPPRSPLDHRFRLPLGRLMPMQLFVLLFVPMLLMLSWWWRCRRWR
jgi:hypothetical protein